MENQQARIYAVCAVKLDQDYADAAEGTFDAALTNALVSIVAHEWPGQERKKPGKSYLWPASQLLTVITQKSEAEDRAKLAPGEPGVCLIPDPVTGSEPPVGVSEEPTIFSHERMQLPPLDTRIDTATLTDALDVTQAIRHGRGEGRPLERRHIDALLALDSHTSLMALAAEQEDRYERSASEEDERERARASDRLELLGQDVASRRAAEAAEIHDGYHPKHNPEGLDLQDCPVCGYTAFSSSSGDDLGMQIGIGQCLVCHYERSPAIAEAEARLLYYKARWADD